MNTKEDISAQVKAIIRDGEKIREGVSQLLLSVIKESGFQASQLKNSVGEILEGLGTYVKEKGDSVDEKVVEEVIDGVGDAVEAGLNATSLAFDEAKSNGTEFAKDEVNRLKSDFSGLKEIVAEVLGSTAKNLQEVSKSAATKLDAHVGRTVERIEPSILSTLEALKDHPVELTTGLAGTLVSSIGSALQSFGEDLQKKGKEEKGEDDQA